MWHQSIDPFHNIAVSTAVAAIPIVVLFVLLATKKLPGHLATLTTLIVALAIAVVAYHMPLELAAVSTAYGAAKGLFPIAWIVFTAVLLYNLSVKSGSFTVVCRSIESITGDRRLQALLIAYCFGAFLEGSAGFGSPVAITAGMLVGLGFAPLYAAALCLVANSSPVAYGAMGIGIVTAAQTSGLDPMPISIMAARQTAVLSLILPFWLTILMSGFKGAKEIWPAILVTAVSYTITMYVVGCYMGPALPNILSPLVAIMCLTLFLRVWKPATVWRFPNEALHEEPAKGAIPLLQLVRAWTPFLLLILCVGNWGMPGLKAIFDKFAVPIHFGGLSHIILANGKPLDNKYNFDWLSASGTSILVAVGLTILLLRISGRQALEVTGATLKQLRNPLITIVSIVAFAYLANFSGLTVTLGKALTFTGHYFPLVSPLVGWIGVFVSGSDTAANALFCNMQKVTALGLHLNPVLTVCANAVGGVTSKMISPLNIAVACAASHLVGREGQLFRTTIVHSVGLLLIVCVMTYLQAYYFTGMVPAMPIGSAVALKAGVAPMGVGGVSVLIASLAAFAALVYVNFVKRSQET